jgi:hypothetical protein
VVCEVLARFRLPSRALFAAFVFPSSGDFNVVATTGEEFNREVEVKHRSGAAGTAGAMLVMASFYR